MARGQQDVLGLDVAMHDAMRVRIPECVRDFSKEPCDFGDGPPWVFGETRAQGFAFDIGHRVERDALRRARLEQRNDVRMLESRDDFDLAVKPLATDDGTELRWQDLQYDVSRGRDLVRQEDATQSSATQLTPNDVSVAQSSGQAVLEVGQRVSRRRDCLRMYTGPSPLE